MLRLTGKHPVLEHITAFAAAWLAVSYLFVHALRPITVPAPEPGYHIPDLGKGTKAVNNLLYLSDALRHGKSIVLLGSSELNHNFSHTYVPYLFFPRHHVSKVVSFGREGFEMLGMYGLLAGMKPHLNPKTRLVIMLSPDWFKHTDMLPEYFDRNFNDDLLLQLYLDDDPRGSFYDYLSAHQSDFTNMTASQRLFLDDPISILDYQLPGFVAKTVNARAYVQREKLNLLLQRTGTLSYPWPQQDAGSLDWAKYEHDARAIEINHMRRNDLWVRDSFFDSYFKVHKLSDRRYFPPNMDPEPEMNGFKSLLELLRRSKVQALFVMQPVNPRMFDDLHRFDDVDNRIASLCREYGMPYMDMFKQPYEQGLLRDSVHLGELGWVKVDERIAENFGL